MAFVGPGQRRSIVWVASLPRGCNGRRGRSAADEVEGAHGPGAASARTWLRSPPRWSPYAVPFIGACAGDPMRQSSPKRSTCAYCAYRTWRQSAIPEPISTRWPVTSRGTMPVASAMAPRWHAGVRRAPPLAVGPAYAGAPAPDSMLSSRHAYGVFRCGFNGSIRSTIPG